MPGPEAHSEFIKVRIAEEDQQLSRDALRSMRRGVLLAGRKDPGTAASEVDLANCSPLLSGNYDLPLLHFASLSREAHRMEAS